MLSNI